MYAWGLVAFMQSLCNAKQHALLSLVSSDRINFVNLCFHSFELSILTVCFHIQ